VNNQAQSTVAMARRTTSAMHFACHLYREWSQWRSNFASHHLMISRGDTTYATRSQLKLQDVVGSSLALPCGIRHLASAEP